MARSPNYPQLNLAEALERVKQVYKNCHTHKADKVVIAKSLGYTSLNGASLGVIGTLKRYELLQEEADGLKVSDEAVAIIELPKGDPERAKAFESAAFAPQLFAEMHETFGSNLPGDVHLRHFLIKKKFLPKAADDVLRVYRDNLELVADEKGGYNADGAAESRQPEGQPPMSHTTQPSHADTPNSFGSSKVAADLHVSGYPPPAPSSLRDFPLYLSNQQKAVLHVPAEMSAADFKLLETQIEHSLMIIKLTSVAISSPPTRADLEQAKGTGTLEAIGGGEDGTLDT